MKLLQLAALVTFQEYRTLSFLMSFVGKMFNAAQNSIKMKKEVDGLPPGLLISKDIFVEHSDYWQSFEFVFVDAFFSQILIQRIKKKTLDAQIVALFRLPS